MGEQAAKLALSLIGAKASAKPKSIILEPKLVPRASTARRP
jgi:DNA-binding LacI/PurR family transcriptional regulator